MLLKKQGFPEEDELVLCTVTKIHFHSVFAQIDEYGGRTGMIHISEVSPGRIRNIRDFVREGKKVVCKVLRIDESKGHIDLSLRRVNERQRREKLEDIKKEQLAENILSIVSKNKKKDLKKFYSEISTPILKEYEDLYSAFLAVSMGETTLEKLGVSKPNAKELLPLIQQRIRPPEVIIGGEFKIRTYEPSGIEVIQAAFARTKKIKGDYSFSYKGGGVYNIRIIAPEYKEAESILKETKAKLTSYLEKHKASIEFERKEVAQ